MGRIWSDQRKYETWLAVEAAAARVIAESANLRPLLLVGAVAFLLTKGRTR